MTPSGQPRIEVHGLLLQRPRLRDADARKPRRFGLCFDPRRQLGILGHPRPEPGGAGGALGASSSCSFGCAGGDFSGGRLGSSSSFDSSSRVRQVGRASAGTTVSQSGASVRPSCRPGVPPGVRKNVRLGVERPALALVPIEAPVEIHAPVPAENRRGRRCVRLPAKHRVERAEIERQQAARSDNPDSMHRAVAIENDLELRHQRWVLIGASADRQAPQEPVGKLLVDPPVDGSNVGREW